MLSNCSNNFDRNAYNLYNKLSYNRESAMQAKLVMAKSGRLELGDNILRTL